MNLRASQFQAEHDASERRGKDRVRGKPRNLRTLLRWMQHSYGLEAPGKLHSGATLEEDGDPAMTGEAKAWLGFILPRHHPVDGPTDWLKVACATDEDGSYKTPLRCAIAQVNPIQRRNLLSELATNLLFPRDVTDIHGIPGWAANDVVYASLSILWDVYSDRPLPTPKTPWNDLSESQRSALIDGETAA